MTKTVSVHLPDSLLVKVDALAPNRDDFFRHAIEEKSLASTGTTPDCWTSNAAINY